MARWQKTTPTEAQFKSAAIDLARLNGWLVSEMIDGVHNRRQQGDAGAPDLLLAHKERGLAMHVELKTDEGRISKAQELWLDTLEQAGHDCEIWRPRDWDMIEALLTGSNVKWV